ncbi:hypothetical protein [Geoalkalibacter subterraneus]|uniref:hypothetical protein n=1 Tax=Geoalkalibacter subterraneus TaxID=483547 RepID=UPI000B29C2B8|nr:hypothetical protein [Geoalkalibacter subterraneus]
MNQPQPYFANPTNLKEFNDELARLYFPTIDRQKYDQIVASNPPERLARALNLAQNDQGARAFLARLIGVDSLNVPSTPAQPPRGAMPSNEPPPMPAPPQGYAQEPPSPQQGSYQQPPLQQGNYRQPPESARQQPASNGPSAARSASAPSSGQGQGQGGGNVLQDENLSHHVYGGKAALCFETDTTRGGKDGKNAIFTIALDGAASTAPRQYDWANKVRIQLTRDELPVVTAVLLGLLPSCEYRNHGVAKDKGFSIEDQGDKLFIKIFAKDSPVKAVPVTAEDAFYVAQLFVRQLRKNAPWLSGMDVVSLVKAVVVGRKQRQPQSQPRNANPHGGRQQPQGGYQQGGGYR